MKNISVPLERICFISYILLRSHTVRARRTCGERFVTLYSRVQAIKFSIWRRCRFGRRAMQIKTVTPGKISRYVHCGSLRAALIRYTIFLMENARVSVRMCVRACTQQPDVYGAFDDIAVGIRLVLLMSIRQLLPAGGAGRYLVHTTAAAWRVTCLDCRWLRTCA